MFGTSYLAIPLVYVAHQLSRSTAASLPATQIAKILDGPAQVAFLVTVIKVPAAGLFVWLVLGGHVNAAALTMLGSIAIDIVDGLIFARSASAQNVELARSRRVLDAVCDRFLIGLAILSSFGTGFLSSSIALLLVTRELAVMTAVTVPFFQQGLILRPNLASRIGTALGGIIGCMAITGLTPEWLLIPYVLVSVRGLFLYVRRRNVL